MIAVSEPEDIVYIHTLYESSYTDRHRNFEITRNDNDRKRLLRCSLDIPTISYFSINKIFQHFEILYAGYTFFLQVNETDGIQNIRANIVGTLELKFVS